MICGVTKYPNALTSRGVKLHEKTTNNYIKKERGRDKIKSIGNGKVPKIGEWGNCWESMDESRGSDSNVELKEIWELDYEGLKVALFRCRHGLASPCWLVLHALQVSR
jgi:hypothetical protein